MTLYMYVYSILAVYHVAKVLPSNNSACISHERAGAVCSVFIA